MGCASYLIGDEAVGSAAVVDPLESVGADAYIVRAAEAGLTIEQVIESHVHADHASAAPALSSALGLPVSVHASAQPRYPYRGLADGEPIVLGSVSLTVWHTPGHTPDSISLLVADATRAPEPWFVLTGDALFVGDVGRPDLGEDASEAAVREAAHALYRSLHERLLTLADAVEIYPAHYGASACGGLFMSRKPWSTIGFERRTNLALQQPDPESFTRHVLSLLKPPPEARALRQKNLGRAAHSA